ncbi:MAG: hypothetical protein ACRDRD_03920, partial [Pseudonocardiaceae bacterium]
VEQVRPEQVDPRDGTRGVVRWLRVVDLVAARCVIAVLDVTVVVTVVVVTVVAVVVVTAEKASRVRVAVEDIADDGKIAGIGCTGRASTAAGSRAGLGDLWCTWRPGGTSAGHYRLRGRADDLLHRVDHLRRGSTRQQNHRGCRAGGHESQAAVPPGCA